MHFAISVPCLHVSKDEVQREPRSSTPRIDDSQGLPDLEGQDVIPNAARGIATMRPQGNRFRQRL